MSLLSSYQESLLVPTSPETWRTRPTQSPRAHFGPSWEPISPTCTLVSRYAAWPPAVFINLILQTGFVFQNTASGISEEYRFFNNRSDLDKLTYIAANDSEVKFHLPKWDDCSAESSALRDYFKDHVFKVSGILKIWFKSFNNFPRPQLMTLTLDSVEKEDWTKSTLDCTTTGTPKRKMVTKITRLVCPVGYAASLL